MTSNSSRGQIQHYGWWLLGIALMAFALRLVGVFGQGWPYCFYDDESQNIARALRFGATGSLDPNWFHKPTLGYYVLFFEYGVFYGLGRLMGWFQSAQEFGMSFFVDKSAFLAIARINSVVFGTLTVLVAARLARRLSGRQDVALGAALALAVMVGHVSTSQLVKMDVPGAFWTTAMMLGILNVMDRGWVRDYVFTGIVGGLGMATKFYSAPLLIGLLFAHLFASRSARLPGLWNHARRLGTGFLCFVIGFFIGSPYCFLSSRWWNERLKPQLGFIAERMGIGPLQVFPEKAQNSGLVDPERFTVFDSIQHLLGNLASPGGIGWALAALALVAFLVLLWRRSARWALIPFMCLFCVVVFAISSHQKVEPRHLSALYPFLAAMIAAGVTPLFDRLSKRKPLGLWMLAALCLLPIPGFPMGNVVALNEVRLRPDVRVRVARWIEEHIPDGMTVINDHDIVPLLASEQRCLWNIKVCTERARDFKERAEKAREGQSEENEQHLAALQSLHLDKKLEWEFRLKAGADYERSRFDLVPFEHPWFVEKLIMRRHMSAGYDPLSCKSPWGAYLTKVIIEAERAAAPLPGDKAERRFLEMLEADFVNEEVQHAIARARSTGHDLDADEVRELSLERARTFRRNLRLHESESMALVELWRHLTVVNRPWLARAEDDGSSPHFGLPRYFVSVKDLYDRYTTPHKERNFPDWAAFYRDLKAHYQCLEFGSGNPDPRQVVRVWDLSERLPPGDHVTRL